MENGKSRIITIIITALVTAAVCFAALAGYLVFTGKNISENAGIKLPEDSQKNFEKFMDIHNLIENKYLYGNDSDKEWEAIYRGMLDSLDDKYSRYLNAEELLKQQQSVNSSFVGTGIVFKKNEAGAFEIQDLVSGSPAFNSGLMRGDLILNVDGKNYENDDELANALKGEAGTRVSIRIKRNEEEKDFSLVRGNVSNASVEMTTLDGNVGYIRIKSFGEETLGLFEAALSGFERAGHKGLILDLRDNPGGIIDVGIKIADRLLPECRILSTKNKAGEEEVFNSDSKSTSLAIVALVNGGTASTAEVLAAALSENGAAVLIGEATFGKGLIQETHIYNDGTAVNITTKQYYSPSGNVIEGNGVAPSEIVKNNGETSEDEVLLRALEIMGTV